MISKKMENMVANSSAIRACGAAASAEGRAGALGQNSPPRDCMWEMASGRVILRLRKTYTALQSGNICKRRLGKKNSSIFEARCHLM